VELRKFLAILTIAIIILLAIIVWFFPSDEDFRTENSFWNGSRNISSSYSTSPLESLSDLPSSPQGSTLILIPYLDFTDVELEELKYFVTQGGTIILADDYGYGNRVLNYLGLKVRFSGQALLDPLVNYKNKWFPRIVHLKPSPLTSGIENLIFNHAACLTNVQTDDTLALSSRFSFLDLNGNEIWDEDEPTGPLAVVSRHNLGSGQLLLISDPSVFINSMETMAGNNNFIKNIAATTPASLFIDQSHLPPSDLHQTKNLLTRIHGFFITPTGTLGLVVLALTITLIPIWHKKQETLKETSATLPNAQERRR